MDGLLWFLILGGLFYVMMRYGSGAHMVHGHGGYGEYGPHEGSATGGGEDIDPVCGMMLASDLGYGKMHQGTLYRFCSRNCLDKFEAEPDKYLKSVGAARGAS